MLVEAAQGESCKAAEKEDKSCMTTHAITSAMQLSLMIPRHWLKAGLKVLGKRPLKLDELPTHMDGSSCW